MIDYKNEIDRLIGSANMSEGFKEEVVNWFDRITEFAVAEGFKEEMTDADLIGGIIHLVRCVPLNEFEGTGFCSVDDVEDRLIDALDNKS